jgi:hypothetical protein
MNTKLENALDNFYSEEQVQLLKSKQDKIKLLNERDGLIVERLDTIFVDQSGRQLLREIY